MKMDYEYDDDSYDDDEEVYDNDEDFDVEPFFGSLLKRTEDLEKEHALKDIEKTKKEEETVPVVEELPEVDDNDSTVNQDISEDIETRVLAKKRPIKKERKCLLCMTNSPELKYFTLKGAKCRKDDLEGKLQKLLGIPVSNIPGSPRVCEMCCHKALDSYDMWEHSMNSVTEYIKEEEEELTASLRSKLNLLENKLQCMVQKYCQEKLSHFEDQVTIMGNMYVSIEETTMLMFPINSTKEVEEIQDPEEKKIMTEDKETMTDKLNLSFSSKGSADDGVENEEMITANLDGLNLQASDIEVDVEYFDTAGGDNSIDFIATATVDFEEMSKIAQLDADVVDTVEHSEDENTEEISNLDNAAAEEVPKEREQEKEDNSKGAENREPRLSVKISYKDIKIAEEALVKDNIVKGRCPACRDVIQTGEFSKHTDTSWRKKCVQCGFQTSLMCVLNKHSEKPHKGNNKLVNNTSGFQCIKCSRSFLSQFLLNKHLIFGHGSKLVYPDSSPEQSEESGAENEGDDDVDFNPCDPDFNPGFTPMYTPKRRKSNATPKVRTSTGGNGGGGGGGRQRSMVWNYFELTENVCEDRPTARCLLCGVEVTRKLSTTSQMRGHIISHHKEIHLDSGASQKPRLKINTVTGGKPKKTSRKRKDMGDDDYQEAKKTKEQDSEVSSTITSLPPDTQLVVGSSGDLELATAEALKCLQNSGIELKRFAETNLETSMGLATNSMSETDRAVSSLLGQSVQIAGETDSTVAITDLLDNQQVFDGVSSTVVENGQGKGGKDGEEYVTQYVKDRVTGDLVQLRIPQSTAQAGSGPQSSEKDKSKE